MWKESAHFYRSACEILERALQCDQAGLLPKLKTRNEKDHLPKNKHAKQYSQTRAAAAAGLRALMYLLPLFLVVPSGARSKSCSNE